MLIVFLLDTSASMNQRCANGLTLLDSAKSAVEQFLKARLRDTANRSDRYMLVTCEEGPDVIKVLDKFPYTHFLRALKSVKARDLTNIGASMQRIFAFLHLQRLAADIDKFGQGRNPCSVDPTTIMLLTDGTELTTLAGVAQTLLPSGPVPVGADLSMQPFRWDQRVFATVLRIPSVSAAVLERSGPIPQNAPISGSVSAVAMDSNISAFCEFTGGKCFVATSLKALIHHTELTASRLPPCVIVSFEPILHLLPMVHNACQRKMMFIRGGQAGGQGHWPIPEPYLWDPSHPGLPPRESQPVISYKAIDADPYIPANFIYDKYEIEANPIVGFLLKAPPGVCWQVFIRNSKGPNSYGDPFGYLRLNRQGSILTLIVLPYNYPVLWQLLDQVGKMPAGSAKHAPLPQWRQDMERYCQSIPPYYGNPLRKALKRLGIQSHFVPDSMDNVFYNSIGTQLERLKAQACEELSVEMSRILNDQQNIGPNALKPGPRGRRPLQANSSASPNAEAPPGFNSGVNFAGATSSPASASWGSVSAICGIGHGDHYQVRKGVEGLIPAGPSLSSGSPSAGNEITGGSTGPMKESPLFKNPFDVPRDQLIRQLRFFPLRVAMALDAMQGRKMGKDGVKGKSSPMTLLAARLVAKEEDDARHTLPIEKMGDFNEAMMRSQSQSPRNPFAEDQDRNKRSMFGNPYRQDKDGADEAWLDGTGRPPFRNLRRRRKPESPGATGASTATGIASPGDGTSEDSSKPRGQAVEVRMSEAPGISFPREPRIDHARIAMNGSEATPPEPMEERRNVMATAEARQGSLATSGQPERSGSGLEEDSPGSVPAAAALSMDDFMRARKRRRVVVTPQSTVKDQGEVAAFLVNVRRVLGRTKAGDTQKLFELLSISDFPVDKANFVEQLILQAQRMNKDAVTKELQDFNSSLHAPAG